MAFITSAGITTIVLRTRVAKIAVSGLILSVKRYRSGAGVKILHLIAPTSAP